MKCLEIYPRPTSQEKKLVWGKVSLKNINEKVNKYSQFMLMLIHVAVNMHFSWDIVTHDQSYDV